MKRTALASTSLAAFVALSFTSLAAAEKFVGYKHQKGLDLQGYYMPMNEARAGNYVLDHISVGTEAELKAFEKTGKGASPVSAPFMLQFDDVTSKKGENELGQTYYEVTERVLPRAYRLTADSVSFSGESRKLGQVTFTGKPQPAKIRKAKASIGHTSDGPALTGTLTIGKTTVKNVSLTWFGGD